LIKVGKSTGMEDIKNMVMSDMDFPNAANPGTITEQAHVGDDEVENSLKIWHNPPINTFKIVADPANAMGITYLESVFKKVPADVVKMNYELDGNFPAHQPDPLNPKNLVDLQKRVLEEKADLGLAPDGDGDRLMFIDENGNLVPPSIITAIIARELLKDNPNEKIIVDIRYLLTPKKIIEENGGSMEIVRVGHAFITEKLHMTGGIFGGESSGHYFFRDAGNAESQLSVLLCVLKVMTEENKPISEIADELRRSHESGEFNFRVSNAQEIIEKAKEKYADGKISTVDCIEIDYPDWRFSIRTSNTEPLLRLNVEAYEKTIMETKRDELIEFIKSIAHMEEGEEH
jgi:phosphomannomutase